MDNIESCVAAGSRAALTAYSKVITSKFEDVDSSMEELRNAHDALAKKVHDLEQRWLASAASAESAKAECAQMATQYYATKAELDAKMTKIAADVNALPESWASTQGEIPYEQRTEAYMGNLGWDLSVKELEDYGRAALHEAGVDCGSWNKLRAKVGRNQSVVA